MANVITEQRIVDNSKRALIKYVGLIDSAAANTTLLDVSSLRLALNTNGQIMTANANIKSNYRTTVKRIFGYAKANAYIRLQWAGDANSSIVTLGTGSFDYSFENMGDGAVISNPEANATGDIIFTAVTPSSADTFTIFLDLRKDNRDFDAGQTADPVAFNQGPARFV
jgi:hypothetical protein